MKQHHHSSPIRDGIVHTHSLPASLVVLKVADRVVNELLLFLGENNLGEKKIIISK